MAAEPGARRLTPQGPHAQATPLAHGAPGRLGSRRHLGALFAVTPDGASTFSHPCFVTLETFMIEVFAFMFISCIALDIAPCGA